jgi:2-polyprenyl-6-methoxyphenol hydroxylase-like FAD-dependent oxidoreductase
VSADPSGAVTIISAAESGRDSSSTTLRADLIVVADGVKQTAAPSLFIVLLTVEGTVGMGISTVGPD